MPPVSPVDATPQQPLPDAVPAAGAMPEPPAGHPASASALDMSIQGGLTLIEASAGTGKTWTLAVLMVRLILERELLPRQIVVTTFTRAAAAELRSRIRDRLSQMRQLLERAIPLDEGQSPALTAPQINALAQGDAFVAHWLRTRPMSHWVEDSNRLQLALDTLDECFIGTLDSFCQKLLREFAFDLGDGQQLTISAGEAEVMYELTHEAVRRWQGGQPQPALKLMMTTNQMPDVDTLVVQVQSALNHVSVEVAPLTQVMDLEQAQQQMQAALKRIQAIAVDWSEFRDFFEPSNPKVFWTGRALDTSRQLLPEVWDRLQRLRCMEDYWHLPDSYHYLIKAFTSFSTVFGAPGKPLREWLEQHELAQSLMELHQAVAPIEENFSQLKNALRHEVISRVREQLPQRLAAQGETTFGLQMQHLAKQLSQPEQRQVARAIRQRYPVAMVDEFQDTNGDQDEVIKAIYRQVDALEGEHRIAPTLIMVGDPKQAIYGFRGGDIRTYNAALADVKAKKGQILTLSINQRSVAPLVQAVDELLNRRPKLGDDVTYQSVQAGTRPHPVLVCPGGINVDPLRELRMLDQGDVAIQTAWAIRNLLEQASQHQLGFGSPQPDGQPSIERALRPDDVAVLARGHGMLDAVQAELERLHIPYWRDARTSVYASPMAQELVQLMEAMQSPWQHSLLRRVLSSLLGGHSLAELHQLEQNRKALNRFSERLGQASQEWSARGFLAAWSLLAEPREKSASGQPRFWLNLARHSGSQQAQRHLIDLRHLLDLLHQQHPHVAGPHHLLVWLKQQIARQPQGEGEVQRPIPTASGVRLMTIHASKGLEFPVVFALGLDNSSSNAKKDNLKFFQTAQGRSQLSVEDIKERNEQDSERQQSETRRLAYVALTRASHRLYVLLNADPVKKEKSPITPLRYWMEATTATPLPSQPLCLHEPDVYQPPAQQRPALVSRPRRQRQHRGWLTTSYTALMRQAQPHASGLLSVEEEGRDDEESLQEQQEQKDTSAVLSNDAVDVDSLPICFRFAGGATAGDCLHQILENIDPRHPDKWPDLVQNRLQQSGLYQSPEQVTEMQDWLLDIVHAQLPDGAKLADMDYGQRLRELEFILPLGQGRDAHSRWQQIQQALQAGSLCGSTMIPWQQIQQALQALRPQLAPISVHQSERYLKGSIDLVYQHQGRYYIADYKSNRLGVTEAAFEPAAMEASMDHSNYWLQALIYQVALHRLLRLRLGGTYDPDQHLGGVSYLFLRGMRRDQSQGVLHWKISTDLLLQVDRWMGTAAEPAGIAG